nr:unnamed protein product [Callosobruchus analis]
MVSHQNIAHTRITHKCIYCNKTLSSKQALDDHILNRHPDFIASVSGKVHECTECTYKTVFISQLRGHMAKHPDVAHKCIYCNDTFVSKPSLDDHIVKRHPDFIASVSRKIHECTNCTFKTIRASRFKEHIKAKHRNRITIRCIYCNKTFTTKQKLDEHIIKTHPDFIASVSSKVHECTECTYKTTNNCHMKQHMVKHADVGNRCIHCNKTFKTKQKLDDHIIKKHPDFIAFVTSKVHECTECTYKTTDNSHLKQHMAKHPDIPNRCIHCNKAFTTKKRLDDHIIKKHPDFISSVSSKVHECTECTYKTTDNSNLKQHMLKHPDIAGNHITNRCIHCNKTFTTKKRLDDHIMKKHPDFIASVTSKVHQCTECTYKTTNNSHLRRHMIAHTCITHKCIYCNKTLSSKQALDDHILNRHPDFIASVSGKVHECTECTYKTVCISQLRGHMAKHHNITIRCIYCNKIFTTKQRLDDHIIKAHPDFIASVSSKVHECTQCTYKTTDNSHLKQHMVKHGNMTNRCIHCNKTFTTKQKLDEHILKTHPDFIASVSSKVHECTECTYKTTNNSHMKQHMVKHPDIAGNHITTRCIHCNKTFTTKQRLDDHIIKTHLDFIASVSSKVHNCTKCTYKTTSNSHLKRHMAKHSDIAGNRITIRCNYCNKTFTSTQALDDHILNSHPDFIVSVSSKIHECTKCSYKTTITTNLNRHNMTKHPEALSSKLVQH